MTRFGVEHLSVRLGGVSALADISFQVSPGEVVAVIGGDGAGKTTLCRVMSGLTQADEGKVSRPGGHRTGYLPSSSGVWPDLTVEENLNFVARSYRLERGERRRRMQLLLDSTGLDVAARRLGSQLSGGMRQKLGVAMALLPQPLLLVLDEPTTGIDPASRFDLWRLISRVAGEGTAVVMTTTYLDEAERATAVLALESGRTLAWGNAEQVRATLPGRFFTAPFPSESHYRWRRGNSWRFWAPDGVPPPGSHPVEHDLSDVLTAVALVGEQAR